MKTFKELLDQISEAKNEWPASLTPGTAEYKKREAASKEKSGEGSRHKIQRDGDIVRATRKYNSETGESDEPTKSRENAAEAPAKRGRGRPPGKYGSYKKKVAESLEILDTLETQEEIEEFVTSLDEESFEELADYISEALHPNQRVLDKNKNNKLDKEDFKILRGEKKANEEVELDENYRVLAQKGIGAERKEDIKVGHGVDYYHPKDGSKHMGKIHHMDDKGYTVKDDKTGEKHKFEYYRKLAEDTEQLDELSKSTLGSYIKKRSNDVATMGAVTRKHAMDSEAAKKDQNYMQARKSDEMSNKAFDKGWKHRQNIAKAVDKLTKEEVELDEGMSSQQRMDFNKMLSGAMSRSDYNAKWKNTTKSSSKQSSETLRKVHGVGKNTNEEVQEETNLNESVLKYADFISKEVK